MICSLKFCNLDAVEENGVTHARFSTVGQKKMNLFVRFLDESEDTKSRFEII